MGKTTANQKQEIVRRYIAGESAPVIARDYGITKEAVLSILRCRGVNRRPNGEYQRKCSLRQDAFSAITEESAYWIGFLMADGSVITRGRGSPKIVVGLAERDRDHLVKLRDFLGSTHKIGLMKQSENCGYAGSTALYQLTVYSQRLAADLALHGVIPNKTGREEALLLGDNRHFWRGVVDGDGSVRYAGASSCINVVGSNTLMRQFADFCNGNLGTRLSARTQNTIWQVGTTKRSAERIIHFLYEGASIALSRKNYVNNTLSKSRQDSDAGTESAMVA